MPDTLTPLLTPLFVIMPNHIHGIITVGAQFIAPSFQTAPHSHAASKNITSNDKPASVLFNQGVMNHAPTLGEIVRTFKAASVRLRPPRFVRSARSIAPTLRGNAIITNILAATKMN